MNTDRDAERYKITKAYSRIYLTPEWSQVVKDLEAEIEASLITTSRLGVEWDRDKVLDTVREARATRQMIKNIEAKALEHERLHERLKKSGVPVPDLTALD